MELIFVGVVTAVVVAVAKPVWLHADGGRLALHVRARAGDVAAAAGVLRFVRGLVVLTVVDAVADLGLRDAPEEENAIFVLESLMIAFIYSKFSQKH